MNTNAALKPLAAKLHLSESDRFVHKNPPQIFAEDFGRSIEV